MTDVGLIAIAAGIAVCAGLGTGIGEGDFESVTQQRRNHLGHRDSLPLRPLRNCGDLSHRVEHGTLRDFRKTQFFHNIGQLRVLHDQFVY